MADLDAHGINMVEDLTQADTVGTARVDLVKDLKTLEEVLGEVSGLVKLLMEEPSLILILSKESSTRFKLNS